jgi:hypothetical protein
VGPLSVTGAKVELQQKCKQYATERCNLESESFFNMLTSCLFANRAMAAITFFKCVLI